MMTLNYRVIVVGVVGGSIPVVKSSLYLTEKKTQLGRQEAKSPPTAR
jgi:hypothetical protein